MKIAIFGSSGYIGNLIFNSLTRFFYVKCFERDTLKCLTRKDLNTEYQILINKIKEFDLVINCVGKKSKENIFKNFENLSFESNVIIPEKLSYICSELNIIFIHFSSADVNFNFFDKYTIHKKLAEKLISKDSIVFRPTLVINNYKNGNFLELLPKLKIGSLQIILCPIPGTIIQPLLEKDLIECLYKILEQVKSGKSYKGKTIILNSKKKFSIYHLMLLSRKPNQFLLLLPTIIFFDFFKFLNFFIPKVSNLITSLRPLQYLFIKSKVID